VAPEILIAPANIKLTGYEHVDGHLQKHGCIGLENQTSDEKLTPVKLLNAKLAAVLEAVWSFFRVQPRSRAAKDAHAAALF
jgi:hypothetical protein